MVLFVEPAEESILEVEVGPPEKKRVRVSGDKILVIQLVNKDVVDHRVKKRRVGSRADPREYICACRSPRKPWVHMNDHCAVLLGAADPFHGHHVVLCYVAALHQNGLRMLKVSPVIGHRPPPECGPQTGDRGAVSKTGLMFDVGCSE